MRKAIPILGIALCLTYMAAVLGFLLTKTDLALTVWEILTIVGAPAILLVLQCVCGRVNARKEAREAMLVFMGCVCGLTALAHFVNLTVTRPLIAQGVAVPDFFKIGMWPSVEMTIDTLGWGLFMGLAFLAAAWGVPKGEASLRPLRASLFVCGGLCLMGFIGLLLNENLWYIAPMGYGVGTIVVCGLLLRLSEAGQKTQTPERK